MRRLLIVGSGDIAERSVPLRAALAKGGSLPQRPMDRDFRHG